MTCCYCDKTTDLRPYGPNGAMVCFQCAMASPKRKAETERNFALQVKTCGAEPIVIGEEVGPYPHKYKATKRQDGE